MGYWLMKTNHNLPIITQDQALSSYMDSLLGISTNDGLEVNNSEDLDSSTEQAKQAVNKSPIVENQAEPIVNRHASSKQLDFESDAAVQGSENPSLMSLNEVSNEKSNEENKAAIKQVDLSQAEISLPVSEQEAPSLNLSLFLPKVPTIEELDIIEKKEQIKINQVLSKELEKTKQTNVLLKGQLQESLKKLDDYGKTHTEVYAPDWAQPSFQVIIFNVGNLKLALPLNDLNGIVVWDEKFINHMPGSVDWHLGIIQHMGKSVPVIDTLQQVIPPERVKSFMKKRGEFKNIIFIKDDSWGLVCEDIIGIKTLAVEEVKWRSTRTSRRWLYGTVKEYMCALLDTEEFASMLRTGKDSLIAVKTK
jgi:chemotaxis signal transduction protein